MSNEEEKKSIAKKSSPKNSDLKSQILFQSMNKIGENLKENIEHLKKNFENTSKFIELIMQAIKERKNIFLLASGRSAFILQCFATRLVHLGANVYIVTNLASIPRIRDGDYLIVLSGSGTTPLVEKILRTYVGDCVPASIIVITSYPKSVIGRLGDLTIKLLGRTKKDTGHAMDDTAKLTPEGTAFEQIAFTYLDAVIAELAVRMHIDNKKMSDAHCVGT
ncbi:MAG: SIS domain-containing protein [Promethearchaeota archaeon]